MWPLDTGQLNIRDVRALGSPPERFPADGFADGDVTGLWYRGEAWRGRNTRVFAWLGLPEPGARPAPAMVLVHGGGGTAFASWVRWWNARGYAAIAMDTCGCVPGGEFAQRPRHDLGGPPGWGGFDQMSEPPRDHWTYHAVAAIVLAHSLLRSMPEIDPERIGITGNSWGGYLTCIAASVDRRFRFAAPVYGCGSLAESPFFASGFAQLGSATSAWNERWDPSVHLTRAALPMLWINGVHDPAFPVDAWMRSARLGSGPRIMSLRTELVHADGDSVHPDEIWLMAEEHLRGRPGLARIIGADLRGDRLTVSHRSDVAIVGASLVSTADHGDWRERRWITSPLPHQPLANGESGTISATIPNGSRQAFISLSDARGAIVTSDLFTMPSPQGGQATSGS